VSPKTSTRARRRGPDPECAPALPHTGPPKPWHRFPASAVGLAFLFLLFLLLPRVQDNPRLLWTYAGVGCALLAWAALLASKARRTGRLFRIERAPILKSHYIQASVQLCVYAHWGWYWRDVYSEIPLILSQLVFLYAFDALLSWSRGRDWRVGCGPLPIVLSTNVFIWFKDDLYAYQFLLVAVGAMGKEFVKWNREGRRTHIFNPSAFTLSLFSIVLIATGTTHHTRGIEIASTLALPPHIYLEIFLLGLVVQYFFSVTLMTFSAAGVLLLMNQLYQWSTGTYAFVDTNIPIAIFLGLHLLMTDPSTSPRSNLGRVIFGGLYGLANFVLYWLFERWGVPEFYDKLLPVPFLNLSVQAIDRVAKSGLLGRFTRWEANFQPRRLNLVHMACWATLFLTLLVGGKVDAPHEGVSIEYWKQAYRDGKPDVREKLLKVVQSQTEQGSGAASNELGMLYLEGDVIEKNRAAAAHYFATACELGDYGGCANVATQFLFLREARSDRDVALALDSLERSCGRIPDGHGCFLVGMAFESGRGRPVDLERARALYRQGWELGDLDAGRSLARLAPSNGVGPVAPNLPPLPEPGVKSVPRWFGGLHPAAE